MNTAKKKDGLKADLSENDNWLGVGDDDSPRKCQVHGRARQTNTLDIEAEKTNRLYNSSNLWR